jgi:hypothetical protein
MKAKVGFFYEAEGVKSSMRLQSFIALLISAAISGFAIGTKQLDANVIAIVTLFVVAAFVPKAIQKYAEIKETKTT